MRTKSQSNFFKKGKKKLKPVSEPLPTVESSGSKTGLKSTDHRDSF